MTVSDLPRTMPALVYYRSIPRYLAARLASRLWPRHFFAGLAPLALRQVSWSSPEPHWIILRNRLCGICGSDLNLLRGQESFLLEPYASFPAILGHEVVAEVAWSPPGSPWQPGTRVVVEPILSCRTRGLPLCRSCAQGDYNLCEAFNDPGLGPGVIQGYHCRAGGGMAAYMAVDPERLVRLPAGLSDEEAVLTDSLASALQPVLENLPPDDATVVVYGAGIIGQHVIRLLRYCRCRARIVAVARHPFQAELARTGGADEVLLRPGRRELAAAVAARWLPTTLGGGNLEGGAEYFFDCAGGRTALQEGLLLLRSRGRYILTATTATVRRVDISSIWFRQLQVVGSALYGQALFQGRRVHTYSLAVEILASGRYPSAGLLTHVFPLTAYRQAFQTAMQKAANRSVKVALQLPAAATG